MFNIYGKVNISISNPNNYSPMGKTTQSLRAAIKQDNEQHVLAILESNEKKLNQPLVSFLYSRRVAK